MVSPRRLLQAQGRRRLWNSYAYDSVTNEFGSYCSTHDWLIIASKSTLRSWSREFRQFKALLVDARDDAEARPRGGVVYS